MIGNDVVDLQLAKKENNWQRKGFLDKIFTKNEQILIQKSSNREITIWNLWSRKEASYKIWNRKTGIRKYNPIQFECFDINSEIGKVQFELITYFTKTEITSHLIHTIAVSNGSFFGKIKILDNSVDIIKVNHIPFYINDNQEVKQVSKSNHGRYEFIATLSDF